MQLVLKITSSIKISIFKLFNFILLIYVQVEKEKLKIQATLKELKEDALKSFKPRTPKKVTDITTKLQMKKMVEELENEIGKIMIYLKYITY